MSDMMGESSSSSSLSSEMIPFSLVLATGCTTVLLASALTFVLFQSNRKKSKQQETRAPETDTSIITELDRDTYPGGHLTVYYGSQTGTSESFAQQLEREGPDRGFFVHVIDLEDVAEDLTEFLLEEKRRDSDTQISRGVFLVATYGEGEPTDNAAAFVSMLKEKAYTQSDEEKKDASEEINGENNSSSDSNCLVGLDYCVFGLGNRQYEHFNAMGNLFNEALSKVGGNRILEIGLGDDDADLEGDFETWKDSVFWPGVSKLYVKENAAAALLEHQKETTASSSLPDCPYVVKYHDDKSTAKPMELPLDQVHGSSRHYFTSYDCPVSAVRELRSPEASGSTVHMEIDISKNAKDLSYHTADNLGVLPINSEAVVEAVAKALKYDLDAIFSLEAAPHHEWHGAPFPMPISVKECLTRYCDLTLAPRRSELKLLASYAHDPTDKKALVRMSSKEGKTEYREKIMGGHVGMVDLLKLCPSIQVPLEHFIAMCPRLLPRYYTISSSSSVHPTSVHLTVAVTQTTQKDGSIFKGVCSSYLAGTTPLQDTVRVFCRDSTFRLPPDPSRPILMIGPGTGVAPMRALLQERLHQQKSLNLPVGPNVLYFGCKKRSHDYLYQDELEAFQKEGVLDQMYVAFSREQTDKVYVQHLLIKNAKETWDLMDKQKASIYVCGGVKMGNDVTEALKDICCRQGGMEAADAKTYMSQLAAEGRFVQELWT